MRVAIKCSLAFAGLLTVACGVKQVILPSDPVSSGESPSIHLLTESAKIKARNARRTTLRKNTRWREIGSIEFGSIYEPLDQIVIVNGFNVSEAKIVVRDDKIVGYFLPVEHAFVPVEPVRVKFIRE